jgi:myo-inositol-1(or 4)-monophosphatase
MTEWLDICRAAAGDVRAVLETMPTREERSAVLGVGTGGDETTAIDQAAETVVVERLDRSGLDFALVSEELGHRAAREDGAVTVVLDPIDGSINAKRGIPYFSLSIAVAEGPTMADVTFGFVHDFGSGEEWTAWRGGGAFLNGSPIGPVAPPATIELLGLEATKTALIADCAEELRGVAERLRVMGSLALTLCHLAAGRVDAAATLKQARSVDIAAAQLVVRECGMVIETIDEGTILTAPLDLEARTRVVAGATAELSARVAAAIR